MSKCPKTSEGHPILDITATLEGFIRHEISDNGFIRCGDKSANGLKNVVYQAKVLSSPSGTLKKNFQYPLFPH